MTKSRFQKRSMAKIAVPILAVCMLFASCGKKDKDKDDGGLAKSGTFAPPAWVQGSWGATEGGVGPEVYKFTSDDVLMSGVSLKSLPISTPYATVTISETKKTADLYEITMKVKATGHETVSGFWSFKKGDGTYIEFGADESGATNVEYGRLYKR